TTFSGTNLPAGAMVDPTGIFRWMPDSAQAGSYPNVHFEATDGTQTVSEDVSITVAEANLSLSGMTTLGNGTAVGGLAIRLIGSRGGARGLTTDAAGHFRFNDLTPGNYQIRLIAPSTHDYSSKPIKFTLGATDGNGARLIVTPRT